uniref:Uncharacterized protein n=1 Tax=Monodelphis domestica TaxID=13616 RepID=A0A5F8HCU7_MONDO
MAAPSPSGGSGSGSPSAVGPPGPGHTAVSSMQGKRKALKLNFANPPFKSTARFTLNPSGVQNPHIEFGLQWMKKSKNSYLWTWMW